MNRIIGYISYTHGLDGKVKVVPAIDCVLFEKYVKNNQIFISDIQSKEIKVDIVAFNGKSFICKIDGINTIEDAKSILKKNIYIETEEDDDYIDPESILNFDVFVENEKTLYGKIVDFGDYGSGNLIEVKLSNNRTSEFYMCNKVDILNINQEKHYIVIKKRVIV